MDQKVSKLKWTKKEQRQMDQMTSKLMMIHKALHLRDDRLNVSKKKKEKKEDLSVLRIA